MKTIKVTKRNGKQEAIQLDKIVDRITQQTYGLDTNFVIPFEVAQKVIEGITPDISTKTLDVLAMETAAALTSKHPDYAKLAGRLAVSALHKETKKSFAETMNDLYNYVDPKTKTHKPVLNKEFNDLVQKHAEELDSMVIASRDFNYEYFGFKTLEKSYLLKMDGKIVERPQFMIMRTAVQIHGENLEKVKETYDLMSEGYFTHATPTLFNSGTTRPQLASCFLLDVEEDSIEGIFNTLKDCALISKNAGGIGLSITKIRASSAYISGSNGTSGGIIPFLKIFNETARAVDQCFSLDTPIFTENGKENIGDIKKGDKVLTADNTYQTVLEIMEKEHDGEMYQINGKTKVTESHPFLVVHNDDNYDEFTIKSLMKQNAIVPVWVDAKDLKLTDLILKYGDKQ